MFFFGNGDIEVRGLEAEDAQLLVGWLSDPAVLQYYEGRDRPHDMDMVLEHFYGPEAEEIQRCIILFNSQEAGYIQWYPLEQAGRELYGYTDSAARIFGMDQFIGETSLWNRGIGTRLVGLAVQYLTTVRHADIVVMDPQCWNHRAIAVYERNGFVRKQRLPEHEWHEGMLRDCWLMEYVQAEK